MKMTKSDRHSKVPSLSVGFGRVPTRQPQFGRPAVVMWPRKSTILIITAAAGRIKTSP